MNITVKNFDPANPLHQALAKVTEPPKTVLVHDIPTSFLKQVIKMADVEDDPYTMEASALGAIRRLCQETLNHQRAQREAKHQNKGKSRR